jgi:hypothetical protein
MEKNLFDTEMKDLVLKSELGSALPESIKLRIDETLANLPDIDRKITKPKTIGKKWFIIGAILAGIAGTAAFSAVTNTEQNIESIAETHPYVVIKHHYYKATGELIDKDKLGAPIMEVKRGSGELNLLKDGDTDYFNVGESIYKLKGTNSNEEFAIKHIAGGTKFIPVYKYFILKRSDGVVNPDPKTILGTKNDEKEIGIVMENIRRLDSHFYEFKNMGSRLIVQSADYHPQYRKDYKNGTNVNYHVPEGDEGDIQNLIEVREFRVDKKDEVYSVVFKSNISSQLKVRKEFDLNGLHWKYYGDNLYLGEKDGYYYEIHDSQGKEFSEDKMMEFIKNFQYE